MTICTKTRHWLFAVAASLAFGSQALADQVPAAISAAVADAGRPEADKARDADRKPAETLAFAGVKPGETIVDPKGHVDAIWPVGLPAERLAPTKALAADPAYGNISESEKNIADIPAASIDLFWTSQNYHDLHNRKDVTVTDIDKAVFAALKPGGTFIVLDHTATAGSGFADTGTLHRIDPDAVKKEVESVGFKLSGESDLLKNPDDPHTAKVFDPSIRGKTDQFILKFTKPKA
jgi:predicted methyltransferase